MNKKFHFLILTFSSYFIIGLSVFVFVVGLFMYFNLGKLGTELPVRTVNQFRNIANLMPLVSELSSDIDAIQARNQSIDWANLGFTISKIKIAQGLIDPELRGGHPNNLKILLDQGSAPPNDLKIMMTEISLLDANLSQVVDSNPSMSPATALLFKNRIDYLTRNIETTSCGSTSTPCCYWKSRGMKSET